MKKDVTQEGCNHGNDFSLTKPILTFTEGCQLTGISNSYMYKLTSQRKIPHFKPNGKLIYFDRGELISWLKSNRITTVKEELAQSKSKNGDNNKGG
ncbi:MAG: helix-turn-helix domain-containing protein [Bacteroidales bacterium]|nr:helix-turn-helix domain-containing protein [Bacteroidales bacterium]